MTPTRLAAVLVAAASTVATPAVATPATSAGTQAPAHVRKYVGDAPLAGAGRLTWYGLHVYDAALYAPARLEPATLAPELRGARCWSTPWKPGFSSPPSSSLGAPCPRVV